MTPNRINPTRAWLAAIFLALGATGSLRGALGPSGPEVQVNTTILESQWRPALAKLENGNIVVAWQDDSGAVKFRIYDGNLAPVTGELAADDVPRVSDINDRPKVAALAGGDFILVWQSYIDVGSVFDIYARRFDSGGNAVGDEFRVNQTTAEAQVRPCVAQFGDGTIFIAWEHDTGPHVDLVYRVYEEDLDPISSEVVATQATALDQSRASVTRLSDGNLALAWDSNPGGPVGNPLDCWVRLFSPSGPMGNEVRVNTELDDSQFSASVAPLPDGGAVVVWLSQEQDGEEGGIFGQRFERNAAQGRLDPLGAEFPVNTFTAEDQLEPEAVAWDDGFLVTWTSENTGRNNGDADRANGEDGDGAGVFARVFGIDGAPSGLPFRVNLTTANHQYGGVPLALPGGRIAVAWSATTDGEDYFDANPDNYDEVFLRMIEEAAVAPAAGRMHVGPPASARFRVRGGRATPPVKTFRIRNTGAGALAWRTGVASRWLRVNPKAGNLPSGASSRIAIRPNPRLLPRRPRTQTSLRFDALGSATGDTIRRVVVRKLPKKR